MSDARVDTNGSPAAASVEAYEEDWYRSLRALAERRRGELDDTEPVDPFDGDEATAEPDEPGVAAFVDGDTVVAPAHPALDPVVAGVAPSDAETPVEAEPEPEPLPDPEHEPEPLPDPEHEPELEPIEVAESQPEPEPTGPSLMSRDPAERREALLALADREPTHDEFDAAAALVLDPDPDIRMLALNSLSRFPDRLESTTVRQALQDPADDVRALAVRIAASRGARDLAMLMPLVGARRWPDTQRAVLELLPAVLVLAGGQADELDPLLTAVAELDPAPQDWEREALGKVAAAIGTGTLIEALTLPDMRRLGAVRLLADDRSQAVLEALATRAGDPLEEVRLAGAAAADALAGAAEPGEREPDETKDITELARRLQSDAASDVEAALTALADVERDDIVAWAHERLTIGDVDSVMLVTSIASVLDLGPVAVELLERGAALPAERRRAVVDGLAEFHDPEALARALAGVDVDRRPQAVHMVWQAGGPRLAPLLRSLVADPSVDVRVAVVDVLGQSGDPASIEAVAALLSTDASPHVRAAVVRSIARAGGEIDDVARAIDDIDPTVRATVIEHLPADPADKVGPILAEALADRDERVRRAAMDRLAGVSAADRALAWSALRQCRPEERRDLIEAFVRTDQALLVDVAFEHLYSVDEAERALSIEVVGWGNTQACVEAGIRALGDPSADVRRIAVDALGRLRDRSAVSALGKALGDPDPEVRSGAVRALGVIDDEGVLSFLVAALKDPEQSVRETASHVLTEWSSPAVAKRLAGVLTVPSLRESAADLLMRIGPTSVELLIDVLRQGTADLRETVGPLLYSLVGTEEFLQRMDSLEPERRLRAVEALGAIGGPDAVDALATALSDPDEHVRLRAAQLLGVLGDPRVADAVARLLDDPVPEVAAAAREALESSLDRRSVDGYEESYG